MKHCTYSRPIIKKKKVTTTFNNNFELLSPLLACTEQCICCVTGSYRCCTGTNSSFPPCSCNPGSQCGT